MKCLVTGGAGFIGSNLVDELLKQGNEVLVIDNLSSGRKENINKKAVFKKADITDFNKIKSFFKNVDVVFHLAAIPSVGFSIKDPVKTSEVNILGTINVFQAAVEAGVKKIVFSSSSAVYGEQDVLPIKEEAVLKPISPYGQQKLSGEQFANLFSRLYGIKIISLRYFNVYGPRLDLNSEYSSVIGNFLKLSKEGKELTIFGDGNQTRSFCYVSDIVRANILAANSNVEGTFNVGSQKVYSINELTKIIGGRKKNLPERKGDLKKSEPDISLIKKVFSWEPEISLKEGILLTKNWFLKHG